MSTEPVEPARLRADLGLSLTQMERLTGLSKSTLIRSEAAGCVRGAAAVMLLGWLAIFVESEASASVGAAPGYLGRVQVKIRGRPRWLHTLLATRRSILEYGWDVPEDFDVSEVWIAVLEVVKREADLARERA